uniref:Uncharacterized protein n=1 Tax=Lepeophtheirus salmonis TaxID=72036 RepID=A0A0K2UR73_LEPSM
MSRGNSRLVLTQIG